MQGGTGVDGHLLSREVEDAGTVENGVKKHRERTEDDYRRHGDGGLVRGTFHNGLGSQYGGCSADGATGRYHERGFLVHFQQSPGHDAQEQGDEDDDDIDDDGRKADGKHLLERETESVENDTRAQNLLGAELDAGNPGLGNVVAQAVGVEHTQNDTYDEGTERQVFYPLEFADVKGRERKQSDEENAMRDGSFLFGNHKNAELKFEAAKLRK